MYDIWIRMHRRNTMTGTIECAVMPGPVVNGIRITHDRPYAYLMWGSNGHMSGEKILWNAHTRTVRGVPSLGGQYITTTTHNLNNQHIQIGFFTLTQVRKLFPIIGVMYAMQYQLLESHEAQDWLWIRSCIEPAHDQTDHQFQLRRPSL